MLTPGSSASSSCPSCGTFVPEAAEKCPICGTDLTASAATPVPPPVPGADELETVRVALHEDYEVIRELGRGGMAVVYLARERRLEREVAIKVLALSRTSDHSLVERFQREARTAAQLEHPHIVPIYRVGEAGRVIYFTMKFVRGPSLGSLLAGGVTLPPGEIRRLVAEVGSALDYAARRGVVHRDIKPDNILRDDESARFLVTDFGIARSAHTSQLTEAGMTVGTPRYMSPEQASGQPVDGRSDIYSLGAVAYHCLCGRPPFDEGESMAVLYAHVNTPLPRPTLATSDERALFPLVERMLEKDPGRRFQHGDEVSRAVTGERPSGGSSAPTLETGAVQPAKAAALRVAAERAGDLARVSGAAARREGARAWANAAPRIRAFVTRARERPLVHWLTATPRRAIGVVVLTVALVWGGTTAVHAFAMSRSRCPSDTVGPLRVLIDPLGTLSLRRDLDVYYDVCGLTKDTPYTVRLEVSQAAGGIRGMLGGRSSVVTVSFDETARGPATRRHRTLDLPKLKAGGYALEVDVRTKAGREESHQNDFQFIDR